VSNNFANENIGKPLLGMPTVLYDEVRETKDMDAMEAVLDRTSKLWTSV
jgi:hypothetical protein